MSGEATLSGAVPSRGALVSAMAAVALLASLAAAAGIPGRATYGARATADEPYYLLSALAFSTDGSLNIAEELRAERWRAFHEARLPQQTKPLTDGRRVAPHDPLLAVLLAPGMWWGTWFGGAEFGTTLAKVELALLVGVLAALLLWVAVRRFGVSLRVATVAVAVFCASAPLAAYGHQVYPELPLAVCVTVAVAALTGRFELGGTFTLLLAVTAMPWLAVKSVPVAAALAVLGLATLWRRGLRAAAVALAVAFAVAGGVYLGVYRELYEGWTAYAAGDHFVHGEFTAVGTRVDLIGRSRRLVGLFVDRGFGIAAWQPAWLLVIPATAALTRSRPGGWRVVVLPLLAGYLNATFVAYTMQGWWFPGRQLVVVLPLAVLAVAWWVDCLGRRTLAVLTSLGALGVWSYLWLAGQVAAGRMTWIVDFFRTRDPWYRMWSPLLPNYLRVTDSTWVLHAEWIVVLAGLAWAGWRSLGPVRPPRRRPVAVRAPAFLESDREGSAT